MPASVIYFALMFVAAFILGLANLFAAAVAFWTGKNRIAVASMIAMFGSGLAMLGAFMLGGASIFIWIMHPALPPGMPMNWQLP